MFRQRRLNLRHDEIAHLDGWSSIRVVLISDAEDDHPTRRQPIVAPGAGKLLSDFNLIRKISID